MTILDEIFAHKRVEVAQRQAVRPLADLERAAAAAEPPRDFVAALRAVPSAPALIAEVKHRSPSRGLLAPNFDPLRLARAYAENGAAAISVLTDERYFGGSLHYMPLIREGLAQGGDWAGPPLLRKDFVCDPYQVYEARAAGADAILLIVAALPETLLAELHALACSLGMAALVEVHTAAELETALHCQAALVGINNRDLRDFTVDLATTLQLRPQIPAGVCVVAESGIKGPPELDHLAGVGVDAVLVGEGLVTAADVAARVREFTQCRSKSVA